MRVRLLTLLAVYAALFMNAAAVADEAVYQSSGEPRSVDEILLSLPGGRDAGTVVPLSMRPLIFQNSTYPGVCLERNVRSLRMCCARHVCPQLNHMQEGCPGPTVTRCLLI